MRTFFDTSVLVAAVKAEHPRHARSLRLLNDVTRQDAATAGHCLVELYSTATGYPAPHRVPVSEAKVIVAGLREILSVVVLDEHDYSAILDNAADQMLIGGIVYDAVIARCALNWKARRLYTWNVKDFQRMGGHIARITREP